MTDSTISQSENGRVPMSLDTEALGAFVGDVVRGFSEPYPEDIIDRAFKSIVLVTSLRKRYDEFVATAPSGKRSVNPSIGRLVKAITGMETIESHNVPCLESRELITAFSTLRNTSA
jgi:hypothetical protein